MELLYIYIYIYWGIILMQVLLSFLKLGSHWTLPRDCTVGTSLGGTTRGILEWFPGRVLSDTLLISINCIPYT